MKALLFDLDNTLVRFERGFSFFEPHFTETLRQYGIGVSIEESMRILTGGMINKRLSDRGLPIHEFWATFNVVDYEARKQGLQTGEITLYDDVMPSLERLRGEYLVIVSNTHLNCVMMEMEYLGLNSYFNKIVAYTGTENPKPHPQMAHMALDGKIFSRVFVIGDARADILCGKAIGATTIHLDRFEERIEADFCVKNLLEVPAIVG